MATSEFCQTPIHFTSLRGAVITSCVSSRGNVFGPVRPSVHLSVNTLTTEMPERHTHNYNSAFPRKSLRPGLAGGNTNKEGMTCGVRKRSGIIHGRGQERVKTGGLSWVRDGLIGIPV